MTAINFKPPIKMALIKPFILICYTFILRWIPLVMIGIINPKSILFGFFLLMMFLPEIAILFVKSFRIWLKDGIEDSDGRFNSDDLARLMVHYATIWCMRMYVLFGLLEAFYHIKVSEIMTLGSLAGAFGIEAVTTIMKKRQ